MPQTKGALEVSEFQRGGIVGLYEGGFSQRNISESTSITLSGLNRGIVIFNREGKESTGSRPGLSNIAWIIRNVENNLR